MVTTSFAKPTTVKIGIAAAAVMVSVGGVAFAFAGGSAPTVERGGPPAQPPALPTPSQLSESPSASQDNPPEGEKGQGNNDNNPSPTPSLKGLCNAYTSGGKHGKALDNPAFNYLILSAGGKEKVAGFCADLLDDKHGRSGPRDKDPGRPSEPHPGDKPKHSQPTERPTP